MTKIEDIIANAMTTSKAWPAVFKAGSAAELATAAIAALDAAGLVVVPKEPDDAILDAGLRELQDSLGSTSVIIRDALFAYRAMIEARPK